MVTGYTNDVSGYLPTKKLNYEGYFPVAGPKRQDFFHGVSLTDMLPG
ncbi:MAG: hypothetical protein AB2L24_02960 [Mangrovibacterium sp.]